VEEAFKLVMSAGLVVPSEREKQLSLPIGPPAAVAPAAVQDDAPPVAASPARE
jgi:hypothetical protein